MDCIFLINVYTYFVFFILFFFTVSYKDVVFMVNFKKNSSYVNLTINKFRLFLINTTFLFFTGSLIILTVYKNFIYFNLINILYVSVILTKYYECHKETKENVLLNKDEEKKKYPLFLNEYHLTLSFVLSLYDFYLIYSLTNSQNILFNKILYAIPLTAFFLNLLIFAVIKLIKEGSDFNIKEVKGHIINFLCVLSYILSFSIIFYTELIIKAFDLTRFASGLVIIISGIIYLMYYCKFIKSINKPFAFKVANEKVTNGKIIEVNLRGTKLFINFKNKKSYLLAIGFMGYITLYIFLLYSFLQ